jgi:hypothetical protein
MAPIEDEAAFAGYLCEHTCSIIAQAGRAA